MRLLTDVDNTIVHRGGNPDGKSRSHVADAIKLFAKGGWTVYSWTHNPDDAAVDGAIKEAGLTDIIPPERRFKKPDHPYTPAHVRKALGFLPDLQLDDVELEEIPGIPFLLTSRTGDAAVQARSEALSQERANGGS